jgi:hypothetical protein
MKKALLILGFVVLVFSASCSSEDPEQKYDMIEYVVSSSDYAKLEAQMLTYGNIELTEALVNQLEHWIVLNTSAQVLPTRDVTREVLTDALLKVSSLSRNQVDELFQKVDSIGKYFALLVMQGGYRNIIVIDKL